MCFCSLYWCWFWCSFVLEWCWLYCLWCCCYRCRLLLLVGFWCVWFEIGKCCWCWVVWRNCLLICWGDGVCLLEWVFGLCWGCVGWCVFLVIFVDLVVSLWFVVYLLEGRFVESFWCFVCCFWWFVWYWILCRVGCCCGCGWCLYLVFVCFVLEFGWWF